MNNTTKLFVALAAGAVAGIVLGILFAPAKGEETRTNLKKKGKAFAEDIAVKFKNMKTGCSETEEAFN